MLPIRYYYSINVNLYKLRHVFIANIFTSDLYSAISFSLSNHTKTGRLEVNLANDYGAKENLNLFDY